MKNIKPAILFVGGWFDAEDLSGPLKLFRAMEKNGPYAPNTLVMGPWLHGGWADMEGDKLGNLDFGSRTGEFFRNNIEVPFFVYHLKDRGDGLKTSKEARIPKAWLFETGTNQWRCFDTWPPKEAREKTLYLSPGGKLSFEAAPDPAEIHRAGYQQLVRGEPFRGKFRNSLEKPEPFIPYRPEKIEFVMPDVCHTFRPGHRIMVQIQSF